MYVYLDEENKKLEKYGFIYSCDGQLCQTSLFLKFDSNKFGNNPTVQKEETFVAEEVYQNLGEDILNSCSDKYIQDTLVKDKYVVIGNYTEDIHDTYAGMKPGSYIIYKALLALKEGKHIVSLWSLFMLFIVYFLICKSLFLRSSLIEKIPLVRKSGSKILHYSLSFLSFSTLLLLFDIFEYIIWGTVYSFTVPALFFTITKHFIKYYRYKL